jgi:acetyltransferase-like isoleucine patch superfamily enzyme
MHQKLVHKIWFRLRKRLDVGSSARRVCWSLQGACFGKGTIVPQMRITWPHQLKIGNGCKLEDDIFFKFDGIWSPGPSIVIGDRVFIGKGCEFNIRQPIRIGDDCLIASGCKFIDHDHGIVKDMNMNSQPGREKPILIESDVWLGVNVVVLKGVTLGTGAVIAAGAVVTKSVPPFEIWGGIPARKIGERRNKDREAVNDVEAMTMTS